MACYSGSPRALGDGAHEEECDGGRTGVRGVLVVARATSLRLVYTSRDVELLRRVETQIRRARGRLPPAPGEVVRPSLPAPLVRPRRWSSATTATASTASGPAKRQRFPCSRELTTGGEGRRRATAGARPASAVDDSSSSLPPFLLATRNNNSLPRVPRIVLSLEPGSRGYEGNRGRSSFYRRPPGRRCGAFSHIGVL
jgi:hypothetical protein